MRRQKKRPMHYKSFCLHDGTLILASPIRKPHSKTIKQENLKIDEDGVWHQWPMLSKEFSGLSIENRRRFQDIIATRLNTRRAIREMMFPQLLKLQKDIDDVRNKLDLIQRSLAVQPD